MSPEQDLLRHFHTDLTVGEILQRARLQKGISIEDLEIAIRVSAAHIRAIEEGRLDVLPGRVYALGFIRSYAEYVELDGDKIIGLLKRQSGAKIEPKDITPAQSPMLEDYSLPTGKMFGILIVLFLLAVGFRNFYSNENYISNDDIPSVPKDLVEQTTLLSKPAIDVSKVAATTQSTLPENASGSSTEATLTQPEPVPANNNQIVLRAKENVWLEIRNSSRKTVFSRVLSVGEEYWIPPEQTDLVMTLGNAGGLEIVVDGQALPLLGKTGQVIRNVILDHDKLKQNLKN